MKKSVFILCVALIFSAQSGLAQLAGQSVSKAGTSAATFLQIPVGARAVGMGGAFVSVADDITSLYWNPAGSARLQYREVMFSHIDWIADIRFDFAAVAVPVPRLGTLGISFSSMSMDDMMVRTVERPDGTGELFSSGSIAIGIHYARSLTDKFSIGATAKYVSERIWDMRASGFAIDFGALFTTDFLNGMRIGASMTNFGTDMQMSGRNTRMHGRIDDRKQGTTDRVPMHIEMNAWPMPLGFQFGVANDFIKTEMHLFTVSMDAHYPSNNYQSMNIGGEYGFNNIIFFRAGYQSLFLQDAEGGLTFGAGFHYDLFGGNVRTKVDYGYRDFSRLKEIHILSVAILF